MCTTTPTPWKIEKHLCRCCHAEGTFTNMGIPCYDHLGHQEIYADILKDCLNILITPVAGDLHQPTYTICNDCIQELMNADKFKKQVLMCEKKFAEMYTKNVISVGDGATDEPKVKVEFEGVKSEFKLDFSDDDDDVEVMDSEPDEIRVESDDDFFMDNVKDSSSSDDETLLKPTQKRSARNKASKKPTSASTSKKAAPKKAVAKKNVKKTVATNASGDAAPKNLRPTPTEPEDFISIEAGFRCTNCNKTFKLKAHVKEHVLQIHYKFKRIQIQKNCGCPQCPAKFRTVPEMDQHQLQDHGTIKRFTCKYCPTEFKRQKTLKMHIKSFHKLGQLFKCDQCEYETYGDPQNLRQHKLRHAQVRHIVCLYCGKAFVRPRNLAIHEKIHTRKNIKYCDHCNSSYVTLKGLRKHILKQHLDNPGAADDVAREGPKARKVRKKKAVNVEQFESVQEVGTG